MRSLVWKVSVNSKRHSRTICPRLSDWRNSGMRCPLRLFLTKKSWISSLSRPRSTPKTFISLFVRISLRNASRNVKQRKQPKLLSPSVHVDVLWIKKRQQPNSQLNRPRKLLRFSPPRINSWVRHSGISSGSSVMLIALKQRMPRFLRESPSRRLWLIKRPWKRWWQMLWQSARLNARLNGRLKRLQRL